MLQTRGLVAIFTISNFEQNLDQDRMRSFFEHKFGHCIKYRDSETVSQVAEYWETSPNEVFIHNEKVHLLVHSTLISAEQLSEMCPWMIFLGCVSKEESTGEEQIWNLVHDFWDGYDVRSAQERGRLMHQFQKQKERSCVINA